MHRIRNQLRSNSCFHNEAIHIAKVSFNSLNDIQRYVKQRGISIDDFANAYLMMNREDMSIKIVWLIGDLYKQGHFVEKNLKKAGVFYRLAGELDEARLNSNHDIKSVPFRTFFCVLKLEDVKCNSNPDIKGIPSRLLNNAERIIIVVIKCLVKERNYMLVKTIQILELLYKE